MASSGVSSNAVVTTTNATTSTSPSVVSPTSTNATTISTQSPTTTTSSTNISDVKNGPLAKAGQDLIAIYQQFTQGNTAPTSNVVVIKGSTVEVDVRGTGDFNALVSALKGAGMQIQNTDPQSATVEGFLPIAQLLTVAQLPQTAALSPVYIPMLSAS